ncbi:hypothetical protein GP486_006228 [Trichoglossum hirsutum]|uniref:Uncharacterized protein n=1 Tax=Trichoglossum hirsutum TaxID=265104 RepID=A0A9P8L7U8_9PEZI|nr:hypothetical protein GP486_006228 [Trichoglossum hirsutum]
MPAIQHAGQAARRQTRQPTTARTPAHRSLLLLAVAAQNSQYCQYRQHRQCPTPLRTASATIGRVADARVLGRRFASPHRSLGHLFATQHPSHRVGSCFAMSGLKDVVKGGWHPKGKDGKGESWREEHKGINQVVSSCHRACDAVLVVVSGWEADRVVIVRQAGWVGMGKDTSRNVDGHVSQPLSTLKDPASFGPPPRRVAAPGAIALDSTGASNSKPPAPPRAGQTVEEQAGAVEGTRPVPGRPPRPPARRYATDSGSGGTNTSSEPPRPNLPPRLPPRLNSNPAAGVTSPPPAYDVNTRDPAGDKTGLNQGALNRLGQAGVSVPGFNIGRRTSSQEGSSGSPVQSPSPTASSGKLNVLQSGFSKLSTSSPPKQDPPRGGTTFAQKQAALRTAEAFRKDPSSVSLADARSAASTANNFRERHGDQVSRGLKTADSLNKKYAIADRASSYAGNRPSSDAPDLPPNKPNVTTESASGSVTPEASIATGKKRPPPPPPPKRLGKGDQGGAAPPLPLASKPKPGYTVSNNT